MDNLNSLPGLQIAYIRGNMNADASLADFQLLGGNPDDPPEEADLLAAQDALAAQAVLDAQAILDAAALDPASYTPDEIAAANEVVLGYAGAIDPQTVVDGFAANYSLPAQTVIDQFNAWTTYQGTAALAEDAFLAASVSYQGELYDDAVFGDLRKVVDEIVGMKGLDTLVTDFDAAAAAEPEPTAPEESTDPTEPEIILPE